MIKILLLFIFITLSYSASLQPLDLSHSHNLIGKSTSVFEDTSGEMSFAQVKNLSFNQFIPQEKTVDSHFFTTSAFWYRFQVHNGETIPVARLIVLGIPWLDAIKIVVIDKHGTETFHEGGDTFSYSHRTVNHIFPNFQHEFASGISTVFVQVKTRDPFVVPLSIVDRFTFLEEAVYQSRHMSFMYGMIVAMLLYNLFLFMSIRVHYYAFYVLYLGLFLVANTSYNCFTFEWFFYDYPVLQNWMEATTIFLFTISGLLFARSFLNLKNHFPFLYRMTNVLILLFIGVMIITAWMGYRYHVMWSIILTLLYGLYVFILSFYILFKGYRYTLFFLLGVSAGLIGALITALTVMAILPYSDSGFRAVEYGMVIDAVLLSLALAQRVKTVQEEKLTAQKEAKTDAMTGLLNRRAYGEIALTEVNRCKRYGGNLTLIMLDIDYFKRVNDTYGHAAGDQVLREIADILRNILRENDYGFRVGGEEFVLLLPETTVKEATHLADRIRIEVESRRIVFLEHEIFTTISFGISGLYPQDRSIEEVEKRADEALYSAKDRGRNQIAIARLAL